MQSVKATLLVAGIWTLRLIRSCPQEGASAQALTSLRVWEVVRPELALEFYFAHMGVPSIRSLWSCFVRAAVSWIILISHYLQCGEHTGFSNCSKVWLYLFCKVLQNGPSSESVSVGPRPWQAKCLVQDPRKRKLVEAVLSPRDLLRHPWTISQSPCPLVCQGEEMAQYKIITHLGLQACRLGPLVL